MTDSTAQHFLPSRQSVKRIDNYVWNFCKEPSQLAYYEINIVKNCDAWILVD